VSAETVFVLADAHLGGVPDAVASALHAFLDTVPRAGDHLVINGDLFEFWFEYDSVIPRRAFPTLARLAAARDRGVRLTVTGGNHDRWGRGFWQRELHDVPNFLLNRAQLGKMDFFMTIGMANDHQGIRLENLQQFSRHLFSLAK